VAVSTMEPEIEIWDLDTIDVMQPSVVLGGRSSNKKPKKDGKVAKFRKGSHKDSVLALAWNGTFRNVLASGSADRTVKVRCGISF
jgi:periodic tryptophan protein 1